MKSQLKGMIEGAILTATYAVLLFLTIYTPIGMISVFILPIPFVVYGKRHGFQPSVWMFVASLGVTFLIAGGVYSLGYTFFFAFIGATMGVLYQKEKSAMQVVLGGFFASLLGILFYILLTSLVMNLNLIQMYQEALNKSVEESNRWLTRLGIPQNPEMEEALRSMAEQIRFMIPSIILGSSMIISFITHWISRIILNRLREPVPQFPPFREWKFPKSFLFYYLMAVILMMFVSAQKEGYLYMVGVNLQPLLQLVMVIQGLSFVAYYFYSKGWGKGAFVIIILLVFLFPPLTFILSLTGILDLGFDLRKRVKSGS
ncbi:YybS family protein [Microaerobacter geothermalis]|uniref:YybS family protein n=1 Tax=Microaerobacter geothermalis TaxID=674972 RepID=UPI001F306A2D|nr:YybS family protein [Microaerobacter geothermalis]MCF6094658.1 YybS family protein [Microaerobacter geothermalis]